MSFYVCVGVYVVAAGGFADSMGVGGLLGVVVRVGSCLKGGIVQQVLLCLDLQAKYLLAKECRYLPICRLYEVVLLFHEGPIPLLKHAPYMPLWKSSLTQG